MASNRRRGNRQSSRYLSAPSSSSSIPFSGFPSAIQLPHYFHPVLEAQTDYFNKTFIETDAATAEMPSYTSPDATHHVHPRQLISITEVNQMRQTLRSRRVNTLTELHRIESVLTTLPSFSTELIHEMTDSWGYYVSSNNFLNELRGLTRQYPFSNELLEDAKARVLNDPSSSRSWNFAWLLLAKIKNDQLIPVYAQRVAYQPSQWGGVHPDPRDAAELAGVLSQEWTRAVDQLLRHWPTAPAC